MKNPQIEEYKEELKETYGPLSDIVEAMEDPFAGAALLHAIEKEKNSTNLIIKEINGKFDNILEKLEKVYAKLIELDKKLVEFPEQDLEKQEMLSERDCEILDFVTIQKKVCADDIKEKFNYRGRNAASARLSKLFKENLLEKIYVGRKVYYKNKSRS